VLAPAELVHDLPGRTRWRVLSRRRDAGWFQRVEESLRAMEGVREVSVNAVTGSVLVIHGSSALELGRKARDAGLFHIAPGVPATALATRPTRSVALQLGNLDARLQRSTDGAIDLKTAAFMALTLFAGLQMVRGRVMPAAMTLLVYAERLLEWEEPSALEASSEEGA
jgi:hypothetical protein